MFSFIAALAATLLLLLLLLPPSSLAQQNGQQYTVWSSVVFQRTGERTPEIIGNLPTTLTSVGANQAYASGQFFRNRYIESAFNASLLGNGDGLGGYGAPLVGLNADVYSNLEVSALALDQQWNFATAQAFLQGLYPPFSPGGNSSTRAVLDPTSLLANSTFIDAPLSGYQYAQIHTAGGLDPNFIYLSGNLDCPAFDLAAAQYRDSQQFSVTWKQFDGIYDTIGPAVFSGILGPQAWDYTNAYAIYDWLQYEYAHNSTVQAAMDRYRDVATNTSYMRLLQTLANEQQYAQLGNLSAVNPLNGHDALPGAALGSISTIAGNLLVARVLEAFTNALLARGARDKLTLLFADFAPLVSLFALVGLPAQDANFYGLPDFASAAVFELWSYTNSSSSNTSSAAAAVPNFPPSTRDLWVRFYFVNGTAGEGQGEDGNGNMKMRSYPLFNRGPDATDMPWRDFRYAMENLQMADDGMAAWCRECHATNLFCSAFNATLARVWNDSDGDDDGSSGIITKKDPVTPVVAGVIGAVVSLALAGLIVGVVGVWLGGWRVHRRKQRPKNWKGGSGSGDFGGGFKGGRKMRSDVDLALPPKGGASVTQEERVGSWELKPAGDGDGKKEEEDGGGAGGERSMRPSMEQQQQQQQQQEGHEQDVFGLKAVQPHERV
ncbi:Hypothetical predicted protein [Lecanosticta acicola]|uniref:Phosphoglycerate mutase-like protein n=1 Tax=Lecanosticta acicola TaxID=111012 RepID=A0AAI8YU34_9PEZI|nr:Hypothetical predicted protein [Lecanosticta acicola]